MNYSFSTLRKIRDNFQEELINAGAGKKTSLAFLETPTPSRSALTEGEKFQVMVIGGLFFESAIIYKIKKKIFLTDQIKTGLPLFSTKQVFLEYIEKKLAKSVSHLALNFAYALKPLLRDNLLDGILLGKSKEHEFKGLLGNTVGKEIENYILKKQKIEIKVTSANDTICLLLSGLDGKDRLSLTCGVVGTGTNFAFFLDNKTAVNLESGNFDKFPQTQTGVTIDKESVDPGRFFFEKEVAGAYLYKHFNILANAKLPSTLDLSHVAVNKNDKRSKIAQKLLARSASLIACQIAGIYNFKKEKRLTFVMEGSLFWQGWKYRQAVENFLLKLAVPKSSITFLKIKNSNLLGAAALFTT